MTSAQFAVAAARADAAQTRDRLYQREYGKKWRATPEGRRAEGDKRRLAKYGLTPAMFDKMVLEAAGYCPICGQQDDDSKAGELVIDHHHASCVVRGLVCQTCNRLLPYIETYNYTEERFRAAAAYLKALTPQTGPQSFRPDGLPSSKFTILGGSNLV